MPGLTMAQLRQAREVFLTASHEIHLVVVFKGRTWRKPVYVHGEPTIDDLIENAGFQFRVDRIIWYERAGRPMVDLLLVKVTRRKFQPIKLGWKRG